MVTTHTTTHSKHVGPLEPPSLHTAAHGPPEPWRVRKKESYHREKKNMPAGEVQPTLSESASGGSSQGKAFC